MSQSSYLLGACMCNFLQSCSSSVTLPFAWIQESVAFLGGFPTRPSHEAFPRRFPTGLSHVPPWCESILGLNVEAVLGKLVSLLWTEHLRDSGNSGTTQEFLSPFCGERLHLRCDGIAGNSFSTTQEMNPSSGTMKRKRGSSGCGWDSRASSRLETGMSRNFLCCSKGVKDPLEVPDVRCD